MTDVNTDEVVGTFEKMRRSKDYEYIMCKLSSDESSLNVDKVHNCFIVSFNTVSYSTTESSFRGVFLTRFNKIAIPNNKFQMASGQGSHWHLAGMCGQLHQYIRLTVINYVYSLSM